MNLENPEQYIADLCRDYWFRGWFEGTGGAVSYRERNIVYMTPTGKGKRNLFPDDVVVLTMGGNSINRKPPSSSAPLFLEFHRHRYNGVIHIHDPTVIQVTRIYGDNFEVSGIENQKGIKGYKNTDTVSVPIIDNKPDESDLLPDFQRLLDEISSERIRNPYAILVRNHGVYVYGHTMTDAERHVENHHLLFEIGLGLRGLK